MRYLMVAAAAVAVAGSGVQAETALERGEYLVRGPGGCGNCHTPFGPEGPDLTRELAGRLVEDGPAFRAVAANLTPAGPVAAWSDAELARAIREGIRPDGSIIGPPMPVMMYRGLSDGDVAAIVAFLRTLPAVANDPGRSEYHIPLPPAWGPPVTSVPEVARGVSVAYGAYLAGPVAHCMECHTPAGPDGHPVAGRAGAGGFEFEGPWGVSVSANITPHADGIGTYSDAEVATMITKGIRPDGSAMKPPMPYANFAAFTPDDLAAVILFLRSLPPVADGG